MRRTLFIALVFLVAFVPDVLYLNTNPEKNISGRYQLVLIFDPDNLDHRITMQYANCLLHWLNLMPVDFIGISTGNFERTMEAKRICSISFPLLLEKDVDFIKKNNLTTCCGSTILVDPKKNVIFKDNQLLHPDLLRQLLERQLNIEIKIFYQQLVWNPPFSKGDILPNFPITKIKNEEKLSLNPLMKDINIITFFSSFSLCPECKYIKRLETLRKISTENYSDRLYIGIFFLDPFTTRDIRKIQGHLPFEFPFETFLAQNFMPHENILITDNRLKCDP